MTDNELQVYVNGRFYPAQEARVSVYSWGFLYGDGVFEGLPVSEGRIFRLHEHTDRLFASAQAVGIRIPLSWDGFLDAIRQTVNVNSLEQGYLRPIVTRKALSRLVNASDDWIPDLDGLPFDVGQRRELRRVIEYRRASLLR